MSFLSSLFSSAIICLNPRLEPIFSDAGCFSPRPTALFSVTDGLSPRPTPLFSATAGLSPRPTPPFLKKRGPRAGFLNEKECIDTVHILRASQMSN